MTTTYLPSVEQSLRLVEGVAYPMRVVALSEGEGEDAQAEFDRTTARLDDAYWERFVRGAFSWARFTTWWVARRFVEPRDIRRR